MRYWNKTKEGDSAFMKFHQLFCNGKESPAVSDTDVRLQWNYIGTEKRNETQHAFSITVWDENGNHADTNAYFTDELFTE